MDVKISLHESCRSNQSLRGEPLTSFPNRLRSVLRWTSKHHSPGRLRWTSNWAKLPFYRIQRGVRRLVRHPYIYTPLGSPLDVKHDSAGRLRWTSNRAEITVYEPSAGSGE